MKKKMSRGMLAIRVISTLIIILAIIAPYLNLISYNTTPVIILLTLVVFQVLDNKLTKENKREV